MANTGLERIRDLYNGIAGTLEIKEDDTDKEAVGIIQDFLIEQGFLLVPDHTEMVGEKHVPNIHGFIGKSTKLAIRNFFGIKPTEEIVINAGRVKELIDFPILRARARLGRLSIKLAFSITKPLKILSFVSLFEGGFWSCATHNQDKQGLSYGIIQWAQNQNRLKDIVGAMKTADAELYKTIFQPDSEGLLGHVLKANGGAKPDGTTTDPKFDFLKDSGVWVKNFKKAGAEIAFQKVQVRIALEDFDGIIRLLKGPSGYAKKIKSERGVAFMVDLSNQYGRAGAKELYDAFAPTAADEKDLLDKIAKKSISHSKTYRLRREFFRDSRFLSDTDF